MSNFILDETFRVAACAGKERFDTPQLANKVAKRRSQRRKREEPYRCPMCNGFHLGSPTPKVLTKVRAKVRFKARQHTNEEW